MKKILQFLFTFFFLFFFCTNTTQGQDKRDYRKEYENFRRQGNLKYNAFRDSCNAAYAEFMRKTWTKFKVKSAIPQPPLPEPIKQPVAEPITDIPINEIVPIVPLFPVSVPDNQVVPYFSEEPYDYSVPPFQFNFYGRSCSVKIDESLRFRIADNSENSCADAWKTILSKNYNSLIDGCLTLRKTLSLCDWAYEQMVCELCKKFCGAAYNDEASLLEMFILTQSGYQVRIARLDGKLIVLFSCNENIYEQEYVPIDGVKFYLPRNVSGTDIQVYANQFPKEQTLSLCVPVQPKFGESDARARVLQSKNYPQIKVAVSINKNLIDFYNKYPLSSRWDIYAAASLSDKAKQELYPVLREAIRGKDEKTAASMLLDFVQTALDYKTDDEQFGYERPLFGDESLYYPFSDCEDRAILYSVLVRELLGLQTVLLFYDDPQLCHVATAVCFRNGHYGNYFSYNGHMYTVCDPTYINASVGVAMPDFAKRGINPKVIEIE
jgi:hypothetical protein